MKPAFAQKIQNFYVTSYKDKFFIDPPAWFGVYVLLEIVYHVPLSLWAIYGLYTGRTSAQPLPRRGTHGKADRCGLEIVLIRTLVQIIDQCRYSF